MLYPLKFHPIYKDKIWGGEKLKTILKKDFFPLPNCGESWEISGVKDNVSVIKNGMLSGRSLTDLIREFKEDLVGTKIYRKFMEEFPLLIKFLDANDDLSIQVHPNDRLAQIRHNSFGKTEMWYIVEAEEGASLISGFNKPLTEEEYIKRFKNGSIEEVLNVEEVRSDDVFFIPAGRVHTIGKGLLVAEIQQTSDITYRIYDFDRKDANGNMRELHVEESREAIDYSFYEEYKTIYKDQTNKPVQLVKCDYFTTNKLILTSMIVRDYSLLDSFIVLICLDGEGMVHYPQGSVSVTRGETILIPSVIKELSIEPQANLKILETFVT